MEHRFCSNSPPLRNMDTPGWSVFPQEAQSCLALLQVSFYWRREAVKSSQHCCTLGSKDEVMQKNKVDRDVEGSLDTGQSG